MKTLPILFLCYQATAFAQSSTLNESFLPNPNKWKEYIQELAEQTDSPELAEALYHELSFIAEHPLDINRVSAHELSQLPFLSDTQIDAILAFRKHFGEILTLHVLKVIDNLDFTTIELLLPFIYIRQRDDRELTSFGHHSLRSRYARKLHSNRSESFLGEPFYHSLQYTYNLDKRLTTGFSTEKDNGEPFRNGYDFYSGYVFLSDIRTFLPALIIGDFKATFGHGLIIHNGFNPARASLNPQSGRRANGFRPHASTNESDFFRGVATSFRSGNFWEFNLFYSLRYLDATLSSDSTFSAFKSDGLHRTPQDFDKKHTLPMHALGANLAFAHNRFGLAFSALAHASGNLSLLPEPLPYNLFAFRGNHNANASFDYYLQLPNARFYGETAIAANNAFASLNALRFTPISQFNLLILLRNYSPRYHALFASAFSQNSDVSNESGLFTALNFLPHPHWKIDASIDLFRHPWLKYLVSAPSSGIHARFHLDFLPRNNLSASLRYNYRLREKDQSIPFEPDPLVRPYDTHRLRLLCQYGNNRPFTLRSSFDAIRYADALATSSGVAFSQNLSCNPHNLPLELDLYAVLFFTDNYNARIFSYEKQLPYAFNSTFLYGHGLRFVALLHWGILPSLNLYTRLALQPNNSDLNLLLSFRL
ncbi:MAG: helix-hairpin-helix domain-containing protein [Tannerellaceae bacterium]|jgi:hypothetical protein|nr:helix-hairpin-helix domain-containing protein [Tannerellaceae bacterium]